MIPDEQFYKSKIRILLADDHSQVRRHLLARLRREPDFEVVGVTLQSIQTLQEAMSKKPELLLIDPMMRDGLGLATLRQLRINLPSIIVVVLTAVVDTTLKMQLEEMRIEHILSKDIRTAELLLELHNAAGTLNQSSG